VHIELGKTEVIPVKALENNAGNQITRDDEKNINANIPSLERRRKCVKSQYRKYGNSTKAIDVWPICWMKIMGCLSLKMQCNNTFVFDVNGVALILNRGVLARF